MVAMTMLAATASFAVARPLEISSSPNHANLKAEVAQSTA
jgi:hypothetical protein